MSSVHFSLLMEADRKSWDTADGTLLSYKKGGYFGKGFSEESMITIVPNFLPKYRHRCPILQKQLNCCRNDT